jgi:hypothetical protein
MAERGRVAQTDVHVVGRKHDRVLVVLHLQKPAWRAGGRGRADGRGHMGWVGGKRCAQRVAEAEVDRGWWVAGWCTAER